MSLRDLALMNIATGGSGDITLAGPATVAGVLYLSFAQAGVVDGERFSYGINDVNGAEQGYALWTALTKTLRRTVFSSSNNNNPIFVSPAALVSITPNAVDYPYPAPTIVTSGSVYDSIATTDRRILVNKTIGSATSVVLDHSYLYSAALLVKDLKGDANTNNITVSFTGGETLDGLSNVTINNPYGYFWFNPLAAGGWYDAS